MHAAGGKEWAEAKSSGDPSIQHTVFQEADRVDLGHNRKTEPRCEQTFPLQPTCSVSPSRNLIEGQGVESCTPEVRHVLCTTP